MFPNICIFGVSLSTYAVLHAAAMCLFGSAFCLLLYKQNVFSRQHGLFVLLIYMIANFQGAACLFSVIYDDPARRSIRSILFLERGLWGWELIFFPMAFAYMLIAQIKREKFLLALSLSLLPTMTVQKLACFAAGCCYGSPTAMPWGVTFPPGHISGLQRPLHPTQVFDAMIPMLIFIVVCELLRKHRLSIAFIFPVVLGFSALGRFVTEFLRGEPRPFWTRNLLYPAQIAEFMAMTLVLTIFTLARSRWRAFVVSPNACKEES